MNSSSLYWQDFQANEILNGLRMNDFYGEILKYITDQNILFLTLVITVNKSLEFSGKIDAFRFINLLKVTDSFSQ